MPVFRQPAADVINDAKYEYKVALTLLHKPKTGLQRPPDDHTCFSKRRRTLEASFDVNLESGSLQALT